jgi:hypothetical protein
MGDYLPSGWVNEHDSSILLHLHSCYSKLLDISKAALVQDHCKTENESSTDDHLDIRVKRYPEFAGQPQFCAVLPRPYFQDADIQNQPPCLE